MSALLLRTLAVGRRQQYEWIEAALDMELRRFDEIILGMVEARSVNVKNTATTTTTTTTTIYDAVADPVRGLLNRKEPFNDWGGGMLQICPRFGREQHENSSYRGHI